MKNDSTRRAPSADEQFTPKVSRRKFLAASGAGLATAAAVASDASARSEKKTAPPAALKGRMTEYKSGDLMIPAYVTRPADIKRKKAPAVLVIHEVFGLNDHIKSIADRIAGAGYVAIAPNFFARAADPPKDLTNVDAIRKAASSIPPEAANRDMQAALDFIKQDKRVIPRLASIGFCMGGGFSYRLAAYTEDLAGAVIFYGRTPLDLAPQVKCPLLANFGETDNGIPPARVQEWVDALKKAGKSVDAKIYPGAGHGFFNDTRAQAYNAVAAADAWQRTLKFFRDRLDKGKG
ncbi:MAG TPA: dienelactone hydrolase family protein [Pyrinomonadaceae bacterium]|nr:dienelactone hydrolase family protein [Pyrinomonadaceae bacterium]